MAGQLKGTAKLESIMSDYREALQAEQERIEGIDTDNPDRQDCIAQRQDLLQTLESSLDELENALNEWADHEVV